MPVAPPPPKLRSTAAVLQVRDVAATMRWYEANLGFATDGFPKAAPHAFGIVSRDGVELMLQCVDSAERLDTYRLRSGGSWHVYVRMDGVHALYEVLRQRSDVEILEPIKRQPYGDTEFVVRDPDGYVLVFSELLSSA